MFTLLFSLPHVFIIVKLIIRTQDQKKKKKKKNPRSKILAIGYLAPYLGISYNVLSL
jgi:hypothetical protein